MIWAIYYIYERKYKGGDNNSMKEKNTQLDLKKLTLISWTKILCKDGKIDLDKQIKMLSLIEKIK